MNTAGDKVIGVVGGVGPQAGNALLSAITRNTNVSSDQQHLSVVLMSFPKYIEDRTSFLDKTSDINPAFSIASIIQKLQTAGATVAGIACNTAHAPQIYDVILDELDKANSSVKLINMVEETCSYINNNYRALKRVGLMTTNGTYRSRLYHDMLLKCGHDVVVPDFQFQNNIIHKMIYDPLIGLKGRSDDISEEAMSLMDASLKFFAERKVELVVLGCTELSLITRSKKCRDDMILVDSLEVLAKSLVREAMN